MNATEEAKLLAHELAKAALFTLSRLLSADGNYRGALRWEQLLGFSDLVLEDCLNADFRLVAERWLKRGKAHGTAVSHDQLPPELRALPPRRFGDDPHPKPLDAEASLRRELDSLKAEEARRSERILAFGEEAQRLLGGDLGDWRQVCMTGVLSAIREKVTALAAAEAEAATLRALMSELQDGAEQLTVTRRLVEAARTHALTYPLTLDRHPTPEDIAAYTRLVTELGALLHYSDRHLVRRPDYQRCKHDHVHDDCPECKGGN